MVCDVWGSTVNSTWVGGESSFWNIASNWNPSVIPDNDGNTFSVIIDSNVLALDEIEAMFQQSRTINQLDCYGRVDLDNFDNPSLQLILTDPNGLTNHGRLDLEINIQGNFTNRSGGYTFVSQRDITDANVYNENGATLEIEYYLGVDPGSFTNYGTVILGIGGELFVDRYRLTNNGVILMRQALVVTGEDNGLAEDIVNAHSGKICGSGQILGSANIANEGIIRALDGDLIVATAFGGNIINTGTLQNDVGSSLHISSGTIDCNNQGIININANGSITFKLQDFFSEPNACTLKNEPNGIIKLLGGTLAATTITQKADANFAGFGGITGNVVIEPNGLIKLTGPTNIVGSVTINAGATLEIRDGQTLITGQTTNNGTIRLIGGTVIFQGGYSGSGNITHEAGTYRNHFDLNSDGIEDFKDFATFADNWLWQATWY